MNSSFQRRFAPILYVLIFFAGFFTACLWFNPQDYLADLPLTLIAIAAVALIWLVYAVMSVRADQRREMLYRETLIHKESVHPVIHAAVHRVEDKPEMLVLALHNYGKGMAEKVKMRVEVMSDNPSAHTMAKAMTQLPAVAEGIDRLASGETYGGIFADSRVLAADLPNQEFSGLVRIRIDCENTFGDACASESVLDLGLLNQVEIREDKPRKKLLY